MLVCAKPFRYTRMRVYVSDNGIHYYTKSHLEGKSPSVRIQRQAFACHYQALHQNLHKENLR